MSTPPALTVLPGGRSRPSPPNTPTPQPTDSWNLDTVQAVELIAPDHHCATLLLAHARSHFPAEIIPGPGSIVRFHPPPHSTDWVTDLLTLVQTWLQTTPLPCAKLRHENRHYLIRAPIGGPPDRTPSEAA